MLWAAVEYVWTALLAIGLLASVTMIVVTAWTGKFWLFRIRKDGRRWPPLRSEHPVKIWLVWLLYGGPLLFVPVLIIIGLLAL